MKSMRFQLDRGHFGVGDRLSLRIPSAVEFAADAEPRGGAGRANQTDDHGETHERLAAPVGAADVREESMFDLIPLARSRRKVADGKGQARAVGQALQLPRSE